MNCKRCGISTPRLTLDQRYCPPCAREVAAKYEQKEPTWQPLWRRIGKAKDLTGLAGAS